MARKRMISPEIWQSEDFSKLSILARLTFIGLFSNADDEGRGRAKAAYLKSIIYPYDEGMRVADIDKALSEIAQNMSVTFYTHDGNEYYFLDNWCAWQKVEKPQTSKIPALSDRKNIIRRLINEESENVRRLVPPNRIEENRIEKKENINARARGEFGNVLLTDSEYGKLKERFSEDQTKKAIEELSVYMQSKGKAYKDYYATLINWIKRNMEAEEKNLTVKNSLNSANSHNRKYTKEELDALVDDIDEIEI